MNIAEGLKPLIVPIASVRADPRNARIHGDRNLEIIKKSLETYGQRKPIVVNYDGIIEAGNGLYQAAKELGWEKIAAVRVKDDGDHAKGYALMDNQSALLADWLLPDLKDLLEELDTGAFGMEATGFSDKEIEDLMTQFHPTDADLPIPLSAPDFSGEDTRGDYLLLACDSSIKRSFWLERLGIKEFPEGKRIITAKDVDGLL